MPSYVKSKYSTDFSSELRVRALSVLADSPTPMTIDEICHADTSLVGITTQKMARSLNELVEAGFVMKTKSKAKNKMVYAAVSQLEEQGYDITKVVC